MKKVFLNELSLDGQFHSIDDFLSDSIPTMKCLKYMDDNKRQISKCSQFYNCKITPEHTLHDLRGIKSDKARKFKILLLKTTDTPPFWDIDENREQDDNVHYTMNSDNISGTSLAEAAESDGILISFYHKDYTDKILDIKKNDVETKNVISIFTPAYLAKKLWKDKEIQINDYLQMRYEGTRLNFSEFQTEYGFSGFEKDEICECMETFDKFIQLESWDAILHDTALHYKKYMPSSREYNWFKNTTYEGKSIDKFRCGNPKRCFGYREKDIFYVLRMERDHKISDNG